MLQMNKTFLPEKMDQESLEEVMNAVPHLFGLPTYSQKAINSLRHCRLPSHESGEKFAQGYHTAEVGKDTQIEFAHVTKAGDESIRNYVTEVLNGTQTFSLNDLKDNSYRVAFVRDPVDRFIAAYMEVQHPSRGYKPMFPHSIQDDFDNFMELYLAGNFDDGRYTIDSHFRAQVHFLSHPNGDGILFDYIGRTESMYQEWETTLSKNLPDNVVLPKLPKVVEERNVAKKPVAKPKHIQRICDLYCHDYCCLDIEFPSECPQSTCPCPSKPPLYHWLTSTHIDNDMQFLIKRHG